MMDQEQEFSEQAQTDGSAELTLAEREAAVAVREMKAAAAEQLRERQLPSKLISCVNFSSDERFSESFEAVCDAFSEALSEEMKKRIPFNTPKKAAQPAVSDPFLEGLGIL